MRKSSKPYFHPRLLHADPFFRPCPVREGDEIRANGIFLFNITRMLADIESGALSAVPTRMRIPDRDGGITGSHIREDHLPSVDPAKPILLGEINEGNLILLDGNHRFEKARRMNMEWIDAVQVAGEDLIPYFTTMQGQKSFVSYWNQKLEQHERDNRRQT